MLECSRVSKIDSNKLEEFPISEHKPFRTLFTKEKALNLNLDTAVYGSFAEIGAGQETAAHFFKVGGASGTVAKTMSAYDMTFSDVIYGKCARYVCEERLITMLDREYGLLEKRLSSRANETKFFALANTVETLNYFKTNQGHGWIGLRFQLQPNTPPNECVIHLRLYDNDAMRQQEVIGKVGVNLLYGCYRLNHDPEMFLNSLVDNIASERLEINMIRLTGPDFVNVDNRLLCLKLVKNGLSSAAMFGPDGQVLQPAETLYKKNIMLLRGRFRPVTHVDIDILNVAKAHFLQMPDITEDNLLILCELTLKHLTSKGEIKDQDFLDRVDTLCSLGLKVMISNYEVYYKVVNFLANFNKDKQIGIALGAKNMLKVFNKDYYQDLKGGILEAFGKLFGRNVKVFVYPAKNGDEKELITSENLVFPPDLTYLFQYLIQNGKIEDLKNINPDVLPIYSREVLKMIRNHESGWKELVPEKVAQAIENKGLFGYRKQPT